MNLSEVNLGLSKHSIHKQSKDDVKSVTVNQSTNLIVSKELLCSSTYSHQ